MPPSHFACFCQIRGQLLALVASSHLRTLRNADFQTSAPLSMHASLLAVTQVTGDVEKDHPCFLPLFSLGSAGLQRAGVLSVSPIGEVAIFQHS